MIIEYLEHTDINQEEMEQFWRDGISLEDWDYMLLIPVEELVDVSGDGEDIRWCPDFRIENMLRGPALNIWYKVEFRGKLQGVGVAFHA